MYYIDGSYPCLPDTQCFLPAGYAIFVVIGELMETEADQLLTITPAVQPVKPRLITDSAAKQSDSATTSATSQ